MTLADESRSNGGWTSWKPLRLQQIANGLAWGQAQVSAQFHGIRSINI